jgi:crotonobetainyl-CoA:carnitine CoA-transferase CaiB-like acyl-CoA transferase
MLKEKLMLTKTPSGPLSGIRVLDLSAYIAGPYGCTLLADYGAEVIKIEPPTGDNLRKYPSTLATESRAFLGLNRGKQGMVLNLKTPEGLNLLLRMARDADVLVHNFRPGVPERLGIDFEQLQQLNARLIYCAVTGFGETGPMKDKAGYDQVLQTMTGMCAMQGERGGTPEIIHGSVVDYYAAALVASGVSSALYERERSGLGQSVGVSLLRSALSMQAARLIWADDEAADIERDFRSGGISGLYPTRKGYLYISANTTHFWHALCEKVGLDALVDNKRYNSIRKRAQRVSEIKPLLSKALCCRTADEWESLLGDEVPCAAARQIEEVFESEQVVAEQMITEFEHPLVGRYRGQSRSVKFSRTPGPQPVAAPTFGQHSDSILEELGCSAQERQRLRDQDIVK